MKQYSVTVDGKVFTCCEALLKSDFDNEPSVDVYCHDAKMITDDVFVGTVGFLREESGQENTQNEREYCTRDLDKGKPKAPFGQVDHIGFCILFAPAEGPVCFLPYGFHFLQ